jgi:hypothetical protein
LEKIYRIFALEIGRHNLTWKHYHIVLFHCLGILIAIGTTID